MQRTVLTLSLFCLISFLISCTPNFDKYTQAMDSPNEFKELLVGVKDIDAQDKYNRTLLMIAMMDNHPEAVEILLDMGADPMIGDGYGNVLFWAIYGQSYDAIGALFKKRPDLFKNEEFFESQLCYALEIGNVEVLNIFLDMGLVPDFKIAIGKTLLQYSVQYAYQNYEIIKTLVSLGADVNVLDYNGLNMLYTIKDNYEMKSVQLLIDAGIDLNLKDKSGKNLMFRKAKANKLVMVKKLLENGAVAQPGMYVIIFIERSFTDSRKERVQHAPGSVEYRIKGDSSIEEVETTTEYIEERKIPIMEYTKDSDKKLYELLKAINYEE